MFMEAGTLRTRERSRPALVKGGRRGGRVEGEAGTFRTREQSRPAQVGRKGKEGGREEADKAGPIGGSEEGGADVS